MAGFRYRTSGGSVSIGPELERTMRGIVEAAVRASKDALGDVTSDVASDVGAHWYDHVNRETGRTGRWSSTVQVDSDAVRATVESDSPTGKGGKASAYYVHRPGPTSVVEKKLKDDEYAEAMRVYRETGSLPDGVEAGKMVNGRPTTLTKTIRNPQASDGKYLTAELVNKPLRSKLKEISKTLGPEIARLARGGG